MELGVSPNVDNRSSETHGIPSKDGRESRTSVIPVATVIRANTDVIDARQAIAIQEGVDEAKRWTSKRKHVIIQQRNHACRDLSMGRSARYPRMDERSGMTHGCRDVGTKAEIGVTTKDRQEAERCRSDVRDSAA